MEEHEGTLRPIHNNGGGYQLVIFSGVNFILPIDRSMADFRILTTKEIKHIKPVNPLTLTFLMHPQ